jgi:hypothetical protein
VVFVAERSESIYAGCTTRETRWAWGSRIEILLRFTSTRRMKIRLFLILRITLVCEDVEGAIDFIVG